MSEFHVYGGECDDYYHVTAFEMTDAVFKYRCQCKRGWHSHGNGGDTRNRTEYRVAHCPHSQGRHMCIHITDETDRKIKSSSK
jgi:hypothetical protein